ncbi:MAG: hypothetical protein HY606_02200 [Planctomycetes bacterium]|nr:hypothetical protein [Planctomycetota bacterium]
MGNIIHYVVRASITVMLLCALIQLQQSAITQGAKSEEHEFQLRKLSSNLDSWHRIIFGDGDYVGYQHILVQPEQSEKGEIIKFTKDEEVNLLRMNNWNIRKKIKAELSADWNLISFDADYYINQAHYKVDYKSEVGLVLITNSEGKKEIPLPGAYDGVFDINLAVLMLAQKNAKLSASPLNNVLLLTPQFVSRNVELSLVEVAITYGGIEKITNKDKTSLTLLAEVESNDPALNIRSMNVDEYGRIVQLYTYHKEYKIILESQFEWLPIKTKLESHYKILANDKQGGYMHIVINPIEGGFDYLLEIVTRHSVYDFIQDLICTVRATVKDYDVMKYQFYCRFGFQEIRVDYNGEDQLYEFFYNGLKKAERSIDYINDPYFDNTLAALIKYQEGVLYKTSSTNVNAFPLSLLLANAVLNTAALYDPPQISLVNYGWKKRSYINTYVDTLELQYSFEQGRYQLFLDKYGRPLEMLAVFGQNMTVRTVIVEDKGDAVDAVYTAIPVYIPVLLKDPVTSQEVPYSPVKMYHDELEAQVKRLSDMLDDLKQEEDEELRIRKYNEFQKLARDKLTYIGEIAKDDISYVGYAKRIQELIDESLKVIPFEQSILLNCESLYNLFLDAITSEDEISANTYYMNLQNMLTNTKLVKDRDILARLTEIGNDAETRKRTFLAYLKLRAISLNISGIIVQAGDRTASSKGVCVINGEAISEGEEVSIGGLQVSIKKVSRFFVEIDYQGATRKFEVLK